MKIAIIGSAGLLVPDLEKYISLQAKTQDVEIIAGDNSGVGLSAWKYAQLQGKKLTEYLPRYDLYGLEAPIRRNLKILEHCDEIYVFWGGLCDITKHLIDNGKAAEIPMSIYLFQNRHEGVWNYSKET